MSKQKIPYIVGKGDNRRIINATSQAQVRQHLTRDQNIRPGAAAEVMELVMSGVKPETAGDE